AADQRASTPSNAAELLTPDKKQVINQLAMDKKTLGHLLSQSVIDAKATLKNSAERLQDLLDRNLSDTRQTLKLRKQILEAFNPSVALRQGYAILRSNGQVVRSMKSLTKGQEIAINLHDGTAKASITSID